MNEKNIAVISETDGFLAKSIAQILSDNQYTVRTLNFDIDKLHEIKNDIEGLVLCLEDTNRDSTFLMYLRDVMTDKGLYACLVGDNVEVKEAEERLSGCRMVLMPRPVNVKDLVKTTDILHSEHIHNEEKKRILVIDDDPMFLKRMKNMLKNAYNVYVANSGTSAIMVLGKHEVDLILLDYEMPVVKGPQVVQMLRQETAFASIPIMFMTGMNDIEHIKTALELKPVNYIIKTQSSDEIYSIIGAYFEGNKMPSGYNVSLNTVQKAPRL